jgi:hypothetical protein
LFENKLGFKFFLFQKIGFSIFEMCSNDSCEPFFSSPKFFLLILCVLNINLVQKLSGLFYKFMHFRNPKFSNRKEKEKEK